MNYIGSKLKLLDFISSSIDQVVKEKHYIFADIFAGTGVVGSHFKKRGQQVIANDLQYYSYVLNRHYIGTNEILNFEKLIHELPELKQTTITNRVAYVCNYLQELPNVNGFVHKNFSPSNQCETNRMYFTTENAMKCDAIRQKIEHWRTTKFISEDEYFFLLCTLIEAVDHIANTASIYGAFLKKFKKTALRPLTLKPVQIYTSSVSHAVYNQDANELIHEIHPDILYLDPPYNLRQYSANYHVLETIAKYDNPVLKGRTGLRDWSSQKSQYCVKKSAPEQFEKLITSTPARYIFLSYNNEGLLSGDQIRDIMQKYGNYGVFQRSYPRFKADSNRTAQANTTIEYLHYLKR